MDLTITVQSYPREFKKPEHSNEIYEAPTTRVFPGTFFKEKISSLVIPYSLSPGIPAYYGRPPTAMMILSAVTVS